MANRTLIVAAAFAAMSVPASAAVTVLGSSDARMCFEAADSTLTPGLSQLRFCDNALGQESLSEHDIVATYVNRGILRLRRNQIEAAITDFDSAIQLDPRQPEAYLNKGAALLRVNNNSEAAELFSASLENNTRRPELAHFGRAVAYEALGNVRGAYQDYREASALSPHWRDPQIELARFRVVGH
jgi:tetratricopeptide (TPR) repeat protein